MELGGPFLQLKAQKLTMTITSNGKSGSPVELFPTAVTSQQLVNFTLATDDVALLRKH